MSDICHQKALFVPSTEKYPKTWFLHILANFVVPGHTREASQQLECLERSMSKTAYSNREHMLSKLGTGWERQVALYGNIGLCT